MRATRTTPLINKLKQIDMKKLTQKEVKLYRRETLVAMLYKYEDMACNIDYIKEPLKSDIIQHNIELIKSRLVHKEF